MIVVFVLEVVIGFAIGVLAGKTFHWICRGN